MEDFPSASGIEALFRDAYAILEEIHGPADQMEAISGSVVQCHRTIQMLEKIHKDQTRTQGAESSQDTFGLRQNLDRFIASCNAFNYMVKSKPVVPTLEMSCMTGTKPAWKRKQNRELHEEFWHHEQMLSLALANAIFMTSLDMQRQNATPDPTLASILRQAEKRHAMYEKVHKPGSRDKNYLKPTRSRGEDLEWEFCLRRYFDYVDSHTFPSNSSQSWSSDTTRRNSSNLALSGPVRNHALPSRQFSYRSYRAGNNEESRNDRATQPLENGRTSREGSSYNEIYTRRRRSSTASTLSTMSAGSSRANSWTGSTAPRLSPTRSISAVSPQSQRAVVPWQPKPASTPAPLPNRQDPSVAQAFSDIISTTHTMSPPEARGYIQGRLAGLDPNATAEIKKSLSTETKITNLTAALRTGIPPGPSRPGFLTQSPEQIPKPQTISRAISEPAPRFELQRPRPHRVGELAGQPSGVQPKLKRRNSKKRLSVLRNEHARSLSTIIERPSTAKSKASSTKSRRSIFGLKKDKLTPVPDMPEALPHSRVPSISESDEVDSTPRTPLPPKPRIVELDESPPPSDPFTTQNPAFLSPPSKPTNSSNLSLVSSAPSFTSQKTTTSISKPLNRLSRLFKKDKSRLQSSLSTPQLSSAMRSAETLRKASLDCLGKNGSKSTLCLVAIQEGPEQPFQVWLSALPYIEGRAVSPRV